MKKETAVEMIFESFFDMKWEDMQDCQKPVIFLQAKEMEKMYYTEFEVLQLLLKLQQTESYDNLYDWFQENKKTNL
jgi:hypothetical protein